MWASSYGRPALGVLQRCCVDELALPSLKLNWLYQLVDWAQGLGAWCVQHDEDRAADSTAASLPLHSPQGSWLRRGWLVCRMAPEILLGQQCSLSVDIYSYGTVCTVELY